MATIRCFEDLIAWQKARQLTKEIYQITAEGVFGRDFGLRDQLRRASVSIMSNIAEGFDRGGRAEFHQFLVIAKASCAEVRCQLYVAKDADYISHDVFSKLLDNLNEVTRVVSGLRIAVQKQRDRQRGGIEKV